MENIEKLNLKIEALKQGFANSVSNYEDRIADLRVQLTEVSQQLGEAHSEVANLRSQVESLTPKDADVQEEQDGTTDNQD